ncbi:E3 ubiquitin-protein ligase Topors-like isoform X2 [Dysidea avara]|uniref:E3 ubiquitin-protein ligase Topors-like isoform X2 n=1 Tax=Dysidea avara TaxID=196820 RepID=UPI00332BFEAE
MEDEKNSSDENVAPAAKAVEAGCPICLESFKDKAFVDVCFHTFCYSCILQWADVVSSCPMCKAPFKSIIHNVRSTDSYDQHDIKPKPVLVSQEVSLAEARRFWYRTTRLSSSKKSRTKSSPSTKRSVPKGRNISAEKRRRAIYAANLWVKPFPAQDGVKKVRETTPKFFKSNPAASHRLIPWLTREFKVILGEEDSGFVVALINSLLDTYDIASPEFAQQLQPFLFEKTAHFVHEFVSFARAPCDMVAYDEKAEYDVPPDGAPLPELVPIENDEPGPSGLNQKYFDEAVQDGKRVDNSPTMKQHCDEDDDSGSVSSRHDKDQEKKQVETRGDKSTVHNRSILSAMTAETVAMTAGIIEMIAGTTDVMKKMVDVDTVTYIVVMVTDVVIIPLVVQQRDILRENEDTDLHHQVLIGVMVVSTLEVLTDTVSILEGKIPPQGVVTEGIQAVVKGSIAITALTVAAVGTALPQDTPVTRRYVVRKGKEVQLPLKQKQQHQTVWNRHLMKCCNRNWSILRSRLTWTRRCC